MFLKVLTAIGAVALTATSVAAAPIVPGSDFFGQITAINPNNDPIEFGGDGIPSDRTAVTDITINIGSTNEVILLGIAATPRFNNADLTDDGAGTYNAMAGLNDGTPGSMSGTLGATWNFSFYAESTSGIDLRAADLKLYYDFDPAAGTDRSDHGVLNLSAFATGGLFFDPLTGIVQGSQNLNFGFLGVDFPGAVDAPTGSFDPFAAGEYTFALSASYGGETGEASIAVNVSAIPVPPAFAALGLGLAAFGAFGAARQRRRAAD